MPSSEEKSFAVPSLVGQLAERGDGRRYITARVAAQQRARVEDLANDHLLRQTGATLGMDGGLAPPELDVLRHLTLREPLQPPATAHPQHRDAASEAFGQRLRADLNPAEDGEVRDVDHAERAQLLLLDSHLQPTTAHSHERSRFGDVHRALVRVPRNQPARRCVLTREERVRLVRQAQPEQRAPGTLRAVDERQRGPRTICRATSIGDHVPDPAETVVGQFDVHAATHVGVPQLGVVAQEAVLAQEHPLDHDLHLVAGPWRSVGLW